MLCSNEGRLEMEGGRVSFDIARGDHDFFLNQEEALRHKEWLMGMKSRFGQEKERLKKISLDYRKGGHWIKPRRPST
jgi:hypothetical protein